MMSQSLGAYWFVIILMNILIAEKKCQGSLELLIHLSFVFCFSTKETFEHKAIEKRLSDDEEGSEEEQEASALGDVQKYMKSEVTFITTKLKNKSC